MDPIRFHRVRFCLIPLMFIFAGCAETLITAAVAPPTAVLRQTASDNVVEFSENSAKVSLAPLEDNRQSHNIVRSISGFQGLLYHATGYSITTEKSVNEIITESIQRHLEKNGIRVFRGKTDDFDIYISGSVNIFNVDKQGGFKGTWIAITEIALSLKPKSKIISPKNIIITKNSERTNWKGSNSGVEALFESLEKAISEIPINYINAASSK